MFLLKELHFKMSLKHWRSIAYIVYYAPESKTHASGPGCSKLTTSLVNVSFNFHKLTFR